PKEGYRHDESPDFEVYGDGDPKSEDYKMELWVPIVKE
ncbi:MAG: GyrI-like domain-containing protein, partial [Anaerococcus vaginalis]